eukprot:PITA_01153
MHQLGTSHSSTNTLKLWVLLLFAEMEWRKYHALLLPFPAQGHINPFMQLAKIFISRNVLVTFLNTDFNHHRLNPKSSDKIRFESFTDGLPPDHGRTLNVTELCESLLKHGPPNVERIVQNLKHSAINVPPISFIVADGCLSFMQHIADKYGIPRVAFWTPSACGFSAYFHMPLLMDEGYIPVKEENDSHDQSRGQIISCIPGMTEVRLKDLPTLLTVTDPSDFMFQFVKNEAQNTLQASLVLLNTFDDLEGPVLKDLNNKLSGKVLSIGPLLLSAGETTVDTNIWKEETWCLDWLDRQRESSVLYVCFGSVTVLSDVELIEFAWGLEASNQRFLWAIRPDLVQGQSAVLPRDFMERCKDRGCFVSWAPQTKVLSHPSVGGFLTHSGWNSTIESITAGVPMICWPFFAEQQTNRRFVDRVWKVGLEMSEEVSRENVEALVRKLMNLDDEEVKIMRKNIWELRESAIIAGQVGGSSYKNMEMCFHRMLQEASS